MSAISTAELNASTLLVSGDWDHSEMSAMIHTRIRYQTLDRSGSTFKVRVYATCDLNGYSSASYFLNPLTADFNVDGNVSNGQNVKDASVRMEGGGSTYGAYIDYTFNVGSGSGSKSVTIVFHSPKCSDPAKTLSTSISYGGTNTAPTTPGTPSAVGTYFEGSIPIGWAESSDAESNTITYGLYGQYWEPNGTQHWLGDGNHCLYWGTGLSYSLTITGYPRGSRFQFYTIATDGIANSATSSWSASYYRNYAPNNPVSVGTDSSYATSSTNVSWTGKGDPEGHAVSYKVKVYKNDVFYATYDATGSPWSLGFSGSDAADTRYTFGIIAVDSLGAQSDEVAGGLCRKVIAPSAPSTLTLSTKYGTSGITVNWTGASASCAGQPISGYHVYAYKMAPGGSWSGTIDCGATTASSYILDINGDAQGTQYKFKVAAYTTLSGTTFEGSASAESPIGKKDTKANAPTAINTYDVYNNVRYYFVPTEKIRVKWTPSSPVDPDSDQTVAYFLYYSKCIPGGSWTAYSLLDGGSGYTTASNSYDFTMDAADVRGTQYKFQVMAAGIITGTTTGFKSDATVTPSSSYKNQIPTAATGFAPAPDTQANYIGTNPNKYSFESSITLNWTAATVNDAGQTQTYAIFVKKAAAGSTTFSDWSAVADSITGTTYTVTDIGTNGDLRGTQYIYGVQTFDGLEYSSMVASIITAHKNNLPAAPTMSYPTNGAVLYDLRPRLAIKINADADSQGQTLVVTWAGVDYNSQDHSSYFSRKSNVLANGDKILFKPPVNGVYGANAVKIKTSDGCTYSTFNSYTVSINKEAFSAMTSDSTQIVPKYTTELMTSINSLRSQYGLGNYSFASTAVTGQAIKMKDMTDMRAAIDEIRTLLNGWDNTNTVLDQLDPWSSLISDGNIFFDKFRVQVDTDSFVEVDDKATGIVFNGSWGTVTDSGDFGGSSRYSNSVGAVLFYTFTGKGVEWIGTADISTGKAKVSIDGVATTLDLCTKHALRQKMLYHKLDMPNSSHTIRIEVLGGSNLYVDKSYFDEIKDVMMNL